jgi:transcription elongation factor GreB
MSKAFTRESDLPETPPIMPARPSLPPGVRNYITPGGAEHLRQEMEQLAHKRSELAAKGEADRSKLQLLDQRVSEIDQSLQSAVIVHPPTEADQQVRFGATVTVRDRVGLESRYRIVGVDEVELDRDWISWRSPVATALLNKKVGERVRVRLPAREEEFEILDVAYE